MHHSLSQAMERKQSFVMFNLITALLLVTVINAMITESPAPQPQTTGNLPMYGHTPGSLHPQECAPRCVGRCSKTAYKKPCTFFCEKCCTKCLCVPPGTYGNKEFCPCYNNWKTKTGGPKCP